jgi:hypothetical protein
MNFTDDDDSVFEQALRADLPSVSEQNRMRQRLLAAGIAAGTALGSTNVAAATQAGFGASALSKLSALSWPAKLGLAAALAAPVAAVPAIYQPVRAADLVSQVQSSAATVRARSLAKTLSAARLQPLEAPAVVERAQLVPAAPEPALAPDANSTARASAASPGALPSMAAPAPSPATNASAVTAEAASAALESPSNAPASDALPARNASTLAAETGLLDRAFAALAAGDRSTASALVAEHARLFPNGLLRQERERARARIAANSKGE